ncbi:MAG: hypothetical protein LH629_16110, partial [Ignavibacteria bacterium]|nr:hypothetical protein [Ignavibacteria bacterium]
ETVIKKDSTENMTIKKDSSFIIKKEMKTKTGKVFTVFENKPSYSMSNYSVSGYGFENSKDTLQFQNKNPMVNTLMTDLDKNGYEEMYILTKSTGSSSFMDLVGVASDSDKTFSEINIPDISEKDIEKNDKFGGYMGHDSVYISDNKLIREFPVYKNSSTNIPSERRKIIYMLKPEGRLYKLVITGAENIK